MAKVKQIGLEDIPEHIKKMAIKGNLIFSSLDYLFGLYDDVTLIGFAGIKVMKTKAIFKVDYIIPEYRGLGLYKHLMWIRFDIINKLGIKTVEATCTKHSIGKYLAIGFKSIKQYKNYTKVRIEL